MMMNIRSRLDLRGYRRPWSAMSGKISCLNLKCLSTYDDRGSSHLANTAACGNPDGSNTQTALGY